MLTLRYEDMAADPEPPSPPFSAISARPSTAPCSPSADRGRQLPALAAMETAGGFPERGPAQKRFFREGRTGQWQDTVPDADRATASSATTAPS